MNLLIKILKHIFVALLTLLLIIFLVLISPVALIFIIYQQLVVLLSKIFRKDLYGQIHTMATVIAADFLYCDPYHATILTRSDFSEPIKLEEIRDKVKKFLEVKKENGNYKYRQMRQTVTPWLGVMFWKWVPNLNCENYIEIIPSDFENNEKGISDILKMKFRKEMSPWKLFISKDGKTVWIYIHHCLADGYSMVKLFIEDIIDQDSYKDIETSPVKLFEETAEKYKMTWLTWLIFSFFGLYHIAKAFISEIPSIRFIRTKTLEEMKQRYSPPLENSKYMLETSLSLDFMKKLRKNYNCSFTPLILAGITGALKNINAKYNLANFPSKLKMFITFPLPRTSRAMENRGGMVLINLPIKLPSPVQRIESIEKHYNNYKYSTFPLAGFYGVKLFMLITPLSILKRLVQNYFNVQGACISNVPGPDVDIKVCNKSLTNNVFYVGTWNFNFYLVCGVIGFKGRANMTFQFDRTLMPYPQIEKEFIHYFEEELRILDELKKTKLESIVQIEA